MRKWLPLAPAGTPGVWFDVFGFLPTRAGSYYPGNVFTTHAGAIASPETTLRAWCALLSNDTAVRWIATLTKLYLYDGASTFTDKSKGGGYTNTATDWSFGQFGNATIATNRVDAVQTATSGGTFADLAGSPPKARIVVTQQMQVLLFDLNDGAEKPDYFCACAPGNQTDWSSAGATLATPIWHQPGKITAAIAFKDYVLVFKQSSVYKLTYTGPTYKWKVELIAVGRGAWGMHDVVACGDVVMFSGTGGAWVFDGASFRSATDWFGPVGQCTGSLFAPISQNVFFFSPTGSGRPALVYNLLSERWGAMPSRNSVGAGPSSIPMMGSPAALAAAVAPTTLLPDLVWVVDTANIVVSIYKNSVYCGNNNETSYAWLVGGVEGIGGRAETHFGCMDLDTTMSLPALTSDPTPSAAELKLDLYTADTKGAYGLNIFSTGVSAAQSNIASSTTQWRFDFDITAVYLRPVIKFPGNSGYLEVNDYSFVTMEQDGEL